MKDEESSDCEPVGKPPLSIQHEIAFVAIISMAQLLTQAGLAQAIAPLHVIGASLGTSNPGILSWFAAGYSLTVGTFILVAGRAGDIFGHKLLFTSGFIWYAIWSTICGLTRYRHSVVFYIIARILQGIGPAIVLPNGLAILGRTYPPGKRKNEVFSIFGATAPSGFNLGAIFAALFAQKANWSWAYYTMGLVCIGVAVAGILVIPEDEGPPKKKAGQSLRTVIEVLDFWAALVGITGLMLFNIVWNQAPISGWSQAWIIVILLLSVLFMITFVYLETYKSKYPLVPKEIFNRETSLILGCIAAGWSSFGIWLYYLWQFATLLKDQTPLLTAAQFIPVSFAGLVAAAVVAVCLARIGAGWIMIGSMSAFMLANLLASIAPVHQTYWALMFVSIVVAPFGMDMSFPAANVVISDFVPKDKQGNAASLVNTILNYSISFGLGIAGTVEVQLNHGGTTDSDLLRGYRSAWRVGIGLATLGIFMALLLTFFITKAKSTAKNSKTNSG